MFRTLVVILSLATLVSACATLQSRTGKGNCLEDGAKCDDDSQCCGKCNYNVLAAKGTCEHRDP